MFTVKLINRHAESELTHVISCARYVYHEVEQGITALRLFPNFNNDQHSTNYYLEYKDSSELNNDDNITYQVVFVENSAGKTIWELSAPQMAHHIK